MSSSLGSSLGLAVVLPAILVAWAQPSHGQTSARVVDESNSAPVVNALIQVLEADSSVLGSAISDEAGGFTVRITPATAFFRISALGYVTRVVTSDWINRGTITDIALEPAALAISGIDVSSTTVCEENSTRAAAVELLVATKPQFRAIEANATREDLAYVMQYVSQRKVWERWGWWFEADTTLAAWDAVMPTETAEAYAARGFARVLNDSVTAYLAPSAEYLGSAHFAENHCFALRAGSDDRQIEFAPKSDLGSNVGISGILTIDPAGRLVEVAWQYQNLEPFAEEFEIPLWEWAVRERHTEFENIRILPVINYGETGGHYRIRSINGVGPMISEWQIRGVFVTSGGGEGKVEVSPGIGRRDTTLTLRPAIRGWFPTEARLVALRPRESGVVF